jgi:hypothetical protein
VDVGRQEYCRQVEAYLCRKNDGHLIRIVGPSFERVCGWAEQGVPLKVAFRGIDRCFERYYGKGPRRRPVRVDYCEADVLDVFDEWRRAVGVAPASPGDGSPRRHESLTAHLERAIARLTALRVGAGGAFDRIVDAAVRELDGMRGGSKGLRGGARAAAVARLAELDAQLVAAARDGLDAGAREALRREAEAELAPFRGRMPEGAFDQSLAACMDRLLRERARLPVLAFE